MLPEPCWSLSIALPRRHVASIGQLLGELGFSIFEEQSRPKGACLIIYSASSADLEGLQSALLECLPGGVPPEQLQFTLADVGSDWAIEWTRHLQPVALTPSVTLYPNGPTGEPGAGELYLEPAFAFGFGEHESTRLVARWLEATCRASPGASVLDVGCGTGVLGLLAAKSGAGLVLGIDVSEAAIAAARSNAALNRLSGLTFEHRAIEAVSGRFDRVVANIEANILCALASEVVPRIAPGGELALAGLISEQCDGVVRRYAEVGVHLGVAECVDDWCLLTGRLSS